MRTTVPPFLVAPETAVNHAGWTMHGGSGEAPLPAEVEHWDYQTVVRLTAAVSVSRSAILDACELDPTSVISVVVMARSDHTNAQHCAARIELAEQPSYDLAVAVDLPGQELGGRLTLDTLLVASRPQPRSPLSPRRPGSILWRTRHHTYLEGTSARFPTDTADFNEARKHSARAGWLLHVDTTDLDAGFMSAVRLTLNTGRYVIRDLLAGITSPETDLLRRVVRWDVTRQLALVALGSEDVVVLPHDPEARTLGGVLRHVLATVWPDEDPLVVQKRWRATPELVELHLQHHARILGA